MAKVLIVEDNDMNLDMLTRRLQRKGYEVLTAHTMASDRAKAMEAGCDDFYTKPIELPGLPGIMNKLLGR